MRPALRPPCSRIVLIALAVCVLVGSSSRAQDTTLGSTPADAACGQVVGALVDCEEPDPRVYIATPLTAGAAKTWLKLLQPVSMPFENETPLEDALKYIRQATADKEDRGLSIYVDPIGLKEAEQTMQSPVTMSLEGIPLETTLKLLLGQLELVYEVQKDGLVIINSKFNDGPLDPTLQILDELTQMRMEVYMLRREVTALRNPVEPSAPRGGVPAPAGGGPGGGGGGGFR